jgi:hypothetical protein
MIFIGVWSSAPDLFEYTKEKNDYFNVILYPNNINRACNNGKPYKGYYLFHEK